MPASFASLNYWGVHGFGFVNAQGQGACQGVTFTPTVLPKGVLAGNDPVLTTRAAPYGISLGRRTAEAGAK